MPQFVFRVPEGSDEQKKLDSLLSSLCSFFELVTYQAIVVVTDEHDRKVSAVLSEMTDMVVHQVKRKPASKRASNTAQNPAVHTNPGGKPAKYTRNLSHPPVAERTCLECGTPTTRASGYCSEKCYGKAYNRRRRAEQAGASGAPEESLDSGEN